MGDNASITDPPIHGDGMEDIDPITNKHPEYVVNDFQIDLPYDHSYLVENLIDPAHIPISHDATSGGGKRENAQAYEMWIQIVSLQQDLLADSGQPHSVTIMIHLLKYNMRHQVSSDKRVHREAISNLAQHYIVCH